MRAMLKGFSAQEAGGCRLGSGTDQPATPSAAKQLLLLLLHKEAKKAAASRQSTVASYQMAAANAVAHI